MDPYCMISGGGQKVTQSLSEVFMAASKDGVMEKQDWARFPT